MTADKNRHSPRGHYSLAAFDIVKEEYDVVAPLLKELYISNSSILKTDHIGK